MVDAKNVLHGIGRKVAGVVDECMSAVAAPPRPMDQLDAGFVSALTGWAASLPGVDPEGHEPGDPVVCALVQRAALERVLGLPGPAPAPEVVAAVEWESLSAGARDRLEPHLLCLVAVPYPG